MFLKNTGLDTRCGQIAAAGSDLGQQTEILPGLSSALPHSLSPITARIKYTMAERAPQCDPGHYTPLHHHHTEAQNGPGQAEPTVRSRVFLYFYIFQKHFLQKYIFDFTIYSFIPLPPGRRRQGLICK